MTSASEIAPDTLPRCRVNAPNPPNESWQNQIDEIEIARKNELLGTTEGSKTSMKLYLPDSECRLNLQLPECDSTLVLVESRGRSESKQKGRV
jgi:hypothetical protein